MYSWGCNEHGQLGIKGNFKYKTPTLIPFFDDNDIKIQDISSGEEHTLFLSECGKVFSTGSNTLGQLGLEKL